MSNLKKNIRCDVDGVLRNFVGSVYRVLKYYYPDRVPEEQPIHKSWYMSNDYPDFDRQEYYDLIFDVHAEEIFSQADPYDGAIDFLDKLYEIEGHDLLIRTHQNDKTAMVTFDWLLNHGANFDGYFVSKAMDYKNYMNTIIIDDKPDNLFYNSNGILMDRDWNQDIEFPRRACNYQEVLNYVNQLI